MQKKAKASNAGSVSKNIRALAAEVIKTVHFEGKSLSVILPDYTAQLALHQEEQSAFFQELCYGSCRWFFRLEAISKQLLTKPIRNKDNSVFYLILIGLYQLEYLNKPDYAVVTETVSALKVLNKTWAKGLINGVLRNFIRDREAILQKVDKLLCQELSHPLWFYQQLKQDWKSDQQVDIRQVLKENNQYPPMWMRINQSKFKKPEDYLVQLEQQKIEYSYNSNKAEGKNKDWGFILNKAMSVNEIPGFTQGDISVQDGSPQYAAELLDVKDEQSVLDVCSAPGGKTAHILERTPKLGYLLALDNKPHRLEKVSENLLRLGIHAELVCSDALELEQWWNNKPFDRILLDVPCSATGVVRRNPDIKLLRKIEEIELLVRQQQLFLKKLWDCLKPGGIILYATCSIFRQENDQQVAKFLAEHEDAKEIDIHLDYGHALEHGWQIMPGEGNRDGFYYAKLQKELA